MYVETLVVNRARVTLADSSIDMFMSTVYVPVVYNRRPIGEIVSTRMVGNDDIYATIFIHDTVSFDRVRDSGVVLFPTILHSCISSYLLTSGSPFITDDCVERPQFIKPPVALQSL